MSIKAYWAEINVWALWFYRLNSVWYHWVWPVLVLYVNQVNQEDHQYYQDQQDQGLVSEEENGGGVHGSGFGLHRTEKDMSVIIK